MMVFNPSRLTLARKRRKLNERELAELAGVSPITISRLEKGKNEPDAVTLTAIVNVLKFPKDFFFGRTLEGPSREAISFRSLTYMTAKERDAAEAASTLAYYLADWVEEKFTLPTLDILNFESPKEPEVAARALRQHFGMGEQPVISMIKLLEAKGIRVFSLVEDTKNVDAFSFWRDNIPYVFINTFKSAERARFDAAHELGHLVLHRHGGPRQENSEDEANAFASAFLMPAADITAQIPFVTSMQELIIAKKRWGVSLSALAYRLNKLKILPDWKYKGFCVQINKLGYRTKEPLEMLREESVVWKKILNTLWNEKITKSHIADELDISLEELEHLIFGLLASPERPANLQENKTKIPSLKLV